MVGSISSLVRGNHNQTAQARGGGSNPIQPRLGTGANVIDVKSLPRGFFRGRRARGGIRGRGGFRGRGGAFAAAGGGAAGAGGIQEFRPGGRARGRGARGRGRGRGRRGGFKDGDGFQGGGGDQADPFKVMDKVELEFDQAVTYGVATRYNPSLTLESLSSLIPAAPSPTPGCLESTVLRNLSFLGMSEGAGTPLGHAGHNTAKHLVENGVHFFASLAEKEWAEEHLQETRRPKPADDHLDQDAQGSDGQAKHKASKRRYIRGPDEAVRNAIINSAVEGKYEKPLYATDPVGTARALHLRSETYSNKDIEQFEEKLVSLIHRAKTGNKTARPRT
ncbi:hypothetical protein CDD81_3154 [Ophiocordyceps australis]|uniref:Uncharacterized protein n=1 Tax=Ophiocordyceps australis TaxID=1399860 RepID=A0A2C5XSP6_9HYPO|nr:hypothetical protein CDD81_3154 [Ophiocordyceps australis]